MHVNMLVVKLVYMYEYIYIYIIYVCIYIYIPFKPTYNQDTVKKKSVYFLCMNRQWSGT